MRKGRLPRSRKCFICRTAVRFLAVALASSQEPVSDCPAYWLWLDSLQSMVLCRPQPGDGPQLVMYRNKGIG